MGAEMKKTRPCIVISPDEMNAAFKTVIVAPITSKKREIPTRILITKNPLSSETELSVRKRTLWFSALG